MPLLPLKRKLLKIAVGRGEAMRSSPAPARTVPLETTRGAKRFSGRKEMESLSPWAPTKKLVVLPTRVIASTPAVPTNESGAPPVPGVVVKAKVLSKERILVDLKAF